MTAPFSVKSYVYPSPAVTTSTFAMDHDLLPGDVLVLQCNRGGSSSTTNGVDALTPATGAHSGLRKLANACRASTHDIAIVAVEITATVPAGTVWSVVQTNGVNRRVGVAAAWHDIVLPPLANATNGTEADDGNGGTSVGPNGSGTSATASTAAASIVADSYSFGAIATGGTIVATPGAGWTALGQEKTQVGSGDRGILAMYKEETTTGIKTATATYSASGGWAAAIAVVAKRVTTPAVVAFKEWNGTSWITLQPKEWNGTAWVNLSPKLTSQGFGTTGFGTTPFGAM